MSKEAVTQLFSKLGDNWSPDLPLLMKEMESLYFDLTGNYLPGNFSKHVERMYDEGGVSVCHKIIVSMAKRAKRYYTDKSQNYPDMEPTFQSRMQALDKLVKEANDIVSGT